MENTATTAAPLLENEYVKELLAVMEANRVPAVKDLLAVFNQVSAMERQLDTAVTELAALRRELSASQKQAHPVKAVLQNTGAAMEKNVTSVRDRRLQKRRGRFSGKRDFRAGQYHPLFQIAAHAGNHAHGVGQKHPG